MMSDSFIKRKLIYNFKKERRRESRVYFNYPINYPYINDKRLDNELCKSNTAPMEVIDISEYGIGFKSKIYIENNTFLSFYISINNCIPFKCIVHIKWTGIDDNNCYAGGYFIGMDLANRDVIRQYILGY